MQKTFVQRVVNDLLLHFSRLKNVSRYNQSPFDVFTREKVERAINKCFDLSYVKIYTPDSSIYVTREPVRFKDRNKAAEYEKISVGEVWAKDVFDCAWFHITGTLPKVEDGKELVFLINVGGEGLIYDSKGKARKSVTCYASQFDYRLGLPIKRVVPIDGLVDGDKIDFWIDAGANDLFGKFKDKARFSELSLAVVNKETRALAYDMQVLAGAVDYQTPSEFTRECLRALKKCANTEITEENAKALRETLKPLLETKNSEEVHTYSAVGHAHLDLAWLWPLRESYRKGARTFTTQLNNIDRYTNYVFGASQAQLYKWIKDKYPEIYDRVKEKIAENRWEVQGATWVEMDSNLISLESMIRQFFYGKKYFKEEFNVDADTLWLPDSFGYSACLPQIMRLAGVGNFITQKMSWNTINKFPYHTFNWEGLDGSSVFAHMLPDDTYNGPVRADRMVFGAKNYNEKDISKNSLMLYGIGDGGAGPGYEHIERAQRMGDLKGLPKVKMETARAGIKRLKDGLKGEIPTHKGELYLEKHRGTYTSQAGNKKYNRKIEVALRNYELIDVIARRIGFNSTIEKDELEEMWKEALLYQFHDVLPGSSIDRVYKESQARYKAMHENLEFCTSNLLVNVLRGKGVYNYNSFEYQKVLRMGNSWYKLRVPQIGFASLDGVEKLTEFSAKATTNTIENDKVKVTFKKGYISSIFDKDNNREVVKKGKLLGVYTRYNDVGDAWDIKPTNYYKKKKEVAELTKFMTETDGATAYAICEYIVKDAVIKQKITITDNSPMVVFDVIVENKMKNGMLRVSFPTTIDSDKCAYNLPFGHIYRATTENNSIERAQFETSGQKFVDLSSDGYGVSLINDCKYGFRNKGSVLDMNLVRSPKGGPGRNIDHGKNTFSYAILPHNGDLGVETYKEAYLFNNPFIFIDNSDDKTYPSYSHYSSDNENVILESVKEPEDGNGVILRLYNSTEETQSVKVNFGGMKPVSLVGVMENEIAPVTEKLEFTPFEVKLLLVK